MIRAIGPLEGAPQEFYATLQMESPPAAGDYLVDLNSKQLKAKGVEAALNLVHAPNRTPKPNIWAVGYCALRKGNKRH